MRTLGSLRWLTVLAGLFFLASPGPADAGITVTLDVEKLVNGVDADSPAAGPNVPVGDPVTFTYLVTNTGQATVFPQQFTLWDDNETPGTADDFTPTFDPASDTIANGFLDIGETWRYTHTTQALLGLHTNVAFITGSLAVQADTDPGNYTGVLEAPSIPGPAPLILLGLVFPGLELVRRVRRPIQRS